VSYGTGRAGGDGGGAGEGRALGGVALQEEDGEGGDVGVGAVVSVLGPGPSHLGHPCHRIRRAGGRRGGGEAGGGGGGGGGGGWYTWGCCMGTLWLGAACRGALWLGVIGAARWEEMSRTMTIPGHLER
jgi:hypothetical protein